MSIYTVFIENHINIYVHSASIFFTRTHMCDKDAQTHHAWWLLYSFSMHSNCKRVACIHYLFSGINIIIINIEEYTLLLCWIPGDIKADDFKFK